MERKGGGKTHFSPILNGMFGSIRTDRGWEPVYQSTKA